jgi:hypothetical protein
MAFEVFLGVHSALTTVLPLPVRRRSRTQIFLPEHAVAEARNLSQIPLVSELARRCYRKPSSRFHHERSQRRIKRIGTLRVAPKLHSARKSSAIHL